MTRCNRRFCKGQAADTMTAWPGEAARRRRATAGAVFGWNQRKRGLRPTRSGAATSSTNCYDRRRFLLEPETVGLRPASGEAATGSGKCYDRRPRKLQPATEKASTGDGKAGGLAPRNRKSCNRR